MVGKGVGIVKKGRAVARKDEVIEALGIEPHLEINAEEVAACSSATIDAALHEKFADDGLQGFSSAGAKHAAEDAIAKARAESKDKFMPLSETLKRIADPEGDINWVAISADKDPFPTDEGAGSIDEMRRAFQSSTVCAAMLRLQFKTPGAMLTKYVYIWWTPDSGEIGMVQRGKLNALQGQVEDTVRLTSSPRRAIIMMNCGTEVPALDLIVSLACRAPGEKALYSHLFYRSNGQ